MRKMLLLWGALAALAFPAGGLAAPNVKAACVGTFSSQFAHDGVRADLARMFAETERPAGRNVYSHVAQEHGGLEECFSET